MRLGRLGSSCTASSRLAAAGWLGVNAKELKSVVAMTGGTGDAEFRNSRERIASIDQVDGVKSRTGEQMDSQTGKSGRRPLRRW